MKATELQIGDWVFVAEYDEYTPAPHNKPYPIQILHGADIDRADEVTFEPIPLTPEILAQNGWKTDDMYAKLQLEDEKWLEYYYHESRLRKYWEGVDEWQNHAVVREITFQCHCSYIHELQHALRLCGLNELADNFQI